MQLSSFVRDVARGPEIGRICGDFIYPAPADFPVSDLMGLIRSWSNHAPQLERWPSAVEPVALRSVRLLAPIPNPGQVLAISQSYRAPNPHSGAVTPTQQVWFSRSRASLQGADSTAPLRTATTLSDYDVELVAVIGRRCRQLRADQARDAIFGYCVGNDLALGPWITTTDAAPDPRDLHLSCRLNGDLRHEASTRELVFDVFSQVAELSQVTTLEPGDLIFTGAPGATRFSRPPSPQLAVGDRVVCEIAALGAIEAVMTSPSSRSLHAIVR